MGRDLWIVRVIFHYSNYHNARLTWIPLSSCSLRWKFYSVTFIHLTVATSNLICNCTNYFFTHPLFSARSLGDNSLTGLSNVRGHINGVNSAFTLIQTTSTTTSLLALLQYHLFKNMELEVLFSNPAANVYSCLLLLSFPWTQLRLPLILQSVWSIMLFVPHSGWDVQKFPPAKLSGSLKPLSSSHKQFFIRQPHFPPWLLSVHNFAVLFRVFKMFDYLFFPWRYL